SVLVCLYSPVSPTPPRSTLFPYTTLFRSAAGGQHRAVAAEQVQRALAQVQRQHAAAGAVGVHDQVESEVFDEEFGVVRQRLLVQRVQDRVAGAIGRGAGALRGALAVLGGHAAERALVDLAFLGARERHALVLEFDDRRDGLAAHVLDRVLVAQPVRALDGVVEVVAPVVRAHVAQRGRDAALRGDGVRAGGKHLGDAGGAQALLGKAEGRAQAGAAGADHDHVVLVFGDLVGVAHGRSLVASPRGRRVARAVAPFPSKAGARDAVMPGRRCGRSRTARPTPPARRRRSPGTAG